jgi:pyruvate formate lyase activating enzyme
MCAEDVIKEVMRDKVFYDTSGGGMTLSGGEPMMQFDFAFELLTLAKAEGLHTCMETCGFAPSEQYMKIAPLVDIFLFDYKETDSNLHREFTGVQNEAIIENLKLLDSIGAKTILRCPIIPTCNDRDEHFEGIAKIANSLKNVIEINVEPYHPLGKSKSELLDRKYVLDDVGFPSDETVIGWIDKIQSKTPIIVKKA